MYVHTCLHLQWREQIKHVYTETLCVTAVALIRIFLFINKKNFMYTYVCICTYMCIYML